VDEDDLESIEKRSKAMTEKILKVLEGSERAVVIVGELHHKDVVQRLKAGKHECGVHALSPMNSHEVTVIL
jgi:pheromone shutdown protein TraB